MTATTATLADFLLARIAEDEAAARAATEPDVFGSTPSFYSSPGSHRDDWGLYTFNVPLARVRAECEAKRALVARLSGARFALDCHPDDEGERGHVAGLEKAVRIAATVYADHEDYQDEWRP